jgi:hypothetical protein
MTGRVVAGLRALFASLGIALLFGMPKRRAPDLADLVREAVKRLTAHRQSRTYAAQWIMVAEVAAALGVDEGAVQTAARKAADWLAIEGEPPHSVSLIYGRGEQ